MTEHDDPLWDPQLPADAELARMQRLLARYRLDTAAASRWASPVAEVPVVPRTRPRWRWGLAAAMLLLAIVPAMLWQRLQWPADAPWPVFAGDGGRLGTLAVGQTLDSGDSTRGLAVARMIAHITYLSEAALHRKFGRSLQDRAALTFSFDADFQVESYLRHQGMTFVDRFDANSYLYLSRAMDYFDLAADHGGSLAGAFHGSKTRFCVVSFTSDWHFPTVESRELVHALNASGASVSFVEIDTDRGHDAFLLDEPELFAAIRGFLGSAARARGLAQ